MKGKLQAPRQDGEMIEEVAEKREENCFEPEVTILTENDNHEEKSEENTKIKEKDHIIAL